MEIQNFTLNKYNSFRDFNLWPGIDQINVDGWINNFSSSEKKYAYHLLNKFIYLSEEMVNSIFSSTIHDFSSHLYNENASKKEASKKWNKFIDECNFTFMVGEVPNVTDSGYTFAKKVRQLITIPEERILYPSVLLKELYNGNKTPVLFVDDFVGSGEQSINTWNRLYEINSSEEKSFQDYFNENPDFFAVYCPLIITEYGKQRIETQCKGLKIHPGYVLDDSYSALSSNSKVWPPHIQKDGSKFLEKISNKIGLPNYGVNNWKGFHNLALSLAIHTSVPDATMPIYYWEKNGWTPLIKRN